MPPGLSENFQKLNVKAIADVRQVWFLPREMGSEVKYPQGFALPGKLAEDHLSFKSGLSSVLLVFSLLV